MDVINRLIELDETETAKQRERVDFLTLMTAVIEALPDGLIVTNLDGAIIFFNEKAELMFGHHRSEMIGQSVEKLIPERFRSRHAHDREMYNRFAIHRRAPTMGIGLNLTGLHSDGHEFSTEITLARMVTPKGIVILSSVRFSPRAAAACAVPPPPPETAIEIPEPDLSNDGK